MNYRIGVNRFVENSRAFYHKSLIFFPISGTTTTVEILDEGSQSWRYGTSAPQASFDALYMVDHPRGGVVYISNTVLYHLEHAGSGVQWTQYSQELRPWRNWFTAFFIPDDVTPCT